MAWELEEGSQEEEDEVGFGVWEKGDGSRGNGAS